MKVPHKYQFLYLFCLISLSCQMSHAQVKIITGAENTSSYFTLLKDKKIGLVANQTSVINNCHLVDTLRSAGFSIKRIFCPEHGFRGEIEAGDKVESYKDKRTGISVISLYGKHYKPRPNEISDLDIIIFDIQDVGVRFYTYLSTLHYVMEACAENNIPLLLLDRPNPNAHYIDGPILDMKFKSFVGMHPVPLVYGMTIGEYAQMINGEKWLKEKVVCNITVIPCLNYTHDSLYQLPVKPSPNLPNMRSIYLYPSLALFEGTTIKMGRNTDFPFQVFGHPDLENSTFTFRLKSNDTLLYKGIDLRSVPIDTLLNQGFTLRYLIFAYQNSPDKVNFFNRFFYNLSGTTSLRTKIENGMSEQEIKNGWVSDLEAFKKIRIKYLLY